MNSNENAIAYCGLYCSGCFNHKGEIADLARDLRKKLRAEKFDRKAPGLSKYFKGLTDYAVCCEVLGAMVRLRCNRNCRQGGGNPGCKIRLCCQKKNVTGCWECVDFESCSKLDFLTPIHGDEHIVNLRKIKKQGVKTFVSGQR